MTDTASGSSEEGYLDLTDPGSGSRHLGGTASTSTAAPLRSGPEDKPVGRDGAAPSARAAPLWGHRDTTRGVARSVQMRAESLPTGRVARNVQVLTMRIERYDHHGNRIPPLPVELRAVHLRGQVSEGEEVIAQGRWRRGTLAARQVTNVTTGATIRASHLVLRKVVPWLLLAVYLAGFALAAGWFVRNLSDSTTKAITEADRQAAINDPLDDFAAPLDQPTSSVTVPDLRRMDAVTAIAKLEELGLRWRAVQETNRSVGYGRVIRTDPGQGATVRRDGAVTIHVSGGSD